MKKTGIAKTLYSLFFGATIFLMLFVLLEFRESYFAVGASGIVFLIAGYLLLDCLQKEKKKEELIQESLEKMIEVQKALYVATKKNSDLLQNYMQKSDENTEKAVGELKSLLQQIADNQEKLSKGSQKNAEMQISALKTVAKYNKENTKQLEENAVENTNRMLAGLQIMPKMIKNDMQDSLETMFQAVEERYQEMADVMLTNTVTMSERIESVISGVERIGDEEPKEEVMEPELELPELELTEIEAEPELESLEPELPSEEPEIELPNIEAEPEIELPKLEPEPVAPVLGGDPTRPMSPDEIAALLASMGGDSEPEPELPSEEPEIELPNIEAEPEIELPKLEPEPVAPVLGGDPNRPMSPDEIAALLASMGGDSEPEPELPSEEPEIELPNIEAELEIELPKLEPEPVAPVLSDDPNHAMSPDEIAALIASMGQ